MQFGCQTRPVEGSWTFLGGEVLHLYKPSPLQPFPVVSFPFDPPFHLVKVRLTLKQCNSSDEKGVLVKIQEQA